MINITELTFIASFIAGIVTFVSPCVLPLIPAYISFITGTSLDKLRSGDRALKSTFMSALFFVLGFILVFVMLGASASFFGNLIFKNKDILRWIGGIIIILFGLHLMGIMRIKFLYQVKRLQIKRKSVGHFGSFLIGIAFAIGWTPCVGPILASILILASAEGSVYRGMMLLFAYSSGLGVLFLLTAVFINKAINLFQKISKFYKVIEIGSGVVLIGVGILLITDSFQLITAYILR